MSFERPIARGDLYFRLKRINELSRDGLDVGVGANADVSRMQAVLQRIEKLAEGAER